MNFIFNGLPARVVFGAGSLSHVEKEVGALGMKRALVLSTPQQESLAQRVAGLLGERMMRRCASEHPPEFLRVPPSR